MKLKYLSIFLLILLLEIVYSQNTTSEAIITFSMPRSFDVYQDMGNEFTITVKNDGSTILHNIVVILSGIPENSYSISPHLLDNLNLGQSSTFSVSVYSQNITTGFHDLTVTMKSNETSETVKMTLNVKGYSKQTGETLKNTEESKPALEVTKNTLIGIMVLSGSILIITCIKFFFKALYSEKGKE